MASRSVPSSGSSPPTEAGGGDELLVGELELAQRPEARGTRLGMRLAAMGELVRVGVNDLEPTGCEWKVFAMRVQFLDLFGRPYPFWFVVQPGPWTWGDFTRLLRGWVWGVRRCLDARSREGNDDDNGRLLAAAQQHLAFVGDPVREAARRDPERYGHLPGFFVSLLWTLLEDAAWISQHPQQSRELSEALHPRDFSALSFIFPPFPPSAPCPVVPARFRTVDECLGSEPLDDA